MKILHHGAAGGVTGSCHRLQLDDEYALLVDCGLFQGDDAGEMDALERHRIEFNVEDIRAVVLTHVHIDHVGRLPYLLAAGYRGPLYCSLPTAELLPLVIEDALKVGFTRDRELIEGTLDQLRRQLLPMPYDEWAGLPDWCGGRVQLRLRRAGHILGSAYVEVAVDNDSEHGQRIVFSGDLGAPWTPLLPAPRPPTRADVVVLESTYGDRLHEDRRHRRLRLKAAIEHALADGGTVMVPAFSIGRTQELLYELEGLIYNAGSQRWRELEVIVDSPLAARFTDVYRRLKPYWDAEATRRLRSGRHPLSFESLHTIDSHEAHLQTVDYLARSRRPAVVIAASGMAAGGRIVNYLKAMLEDPRHDVLIVGYQARGTPGRALLAAEAAQQSGARVPSVELDGQRYRIRARVHRISGYSAHADQRDLLRFIGRMRALPGEVRLVHGEGPAQRALRHELLALARGRDSAMRVIIGRPEGAH